MGFTFTVPLCLLPASSATAPPLASSTYKSSPCDLLPHRLPIPLLPDVPFLLCLPHFCSPLRGTPWTRKLSEPQWTWVPHLLDVYLTLFSGLSSRTASPAYGVTGHLCCLTPQRDCEFPANCKDSLLILCLFTRCYCCL